MYTAQKLSFENYVQFHHHHYHHHHQILLSSCISQQYQKVWQFMLSTFRYKQHKPI